jgi:hypothetical protein
VYYDDIVVGSGLTALGVVLGLGLRKRILVLAGDRGGGFQYYDPRRSVPCAFLGAGGLGNSWHGVIPLSRKNDFAGTTDADFLELFTRFYPHAGVDRQLCQPRLFVPWRPIRPLREFARLQHAHGELLSLQHESADRFDAGEARVSVHTRSGAAHQCRRLWIAAGTLHTPGLLERSLPDRVARAHISDHVLCYVGLINGRDPPLPRRSRDGVVFAAHYEPEARSLYTLRPARFEFRTLDAGIEQRAVFGMPTGSALLKIMRRFSPALLAEAFHNRAGILPRADIYSVYAQTDVMDAYVRRPGEFPLEPQVDVIARATAAAREQLSFPGLQRSRRVELYIPGIHLHHSVEVDSLARHDINQVRSPVQIVDASVVSSLGPDHPSFKLMLAAFVRAARMCAGGADARSA